MYFIAHDTNEFRFRIPDFAKIDNGVIEWETSPEDRARIEADIGDMYFGPGRKNLKDLREEIEDLKREQGERSAAAERAHEMLHELESMIEDAPHHKDEALHDAQHGAFLRILGRIKDEVWKAY